MLPSDAGIRCVMTPVLLSINHILTGSIALSEQHPLLASLHLAYSAIVWHIA